MAGIRVREYPEGKPLQGSRGERTGERPGHALGVFALVLGVCILAPLRALGDDTAPIIELGALFHAGTTGKSITGANGYFVSFRSERERTFFRPSVAFKIDYSSGTASVGSASPNFTLFGASFTLGANFFIFGQGKFQPFVGGSGVIGWDLLKLPSPPTGVENNTRNLSFGYEVNAGVDIRTSSKGNALRVRGAYWAVTSGLAGISGFELNAFQLSLGIVY